MENVSVLIANLIFLIGISIAFEDGLSHPAAAPGAHHGVDDVALGSGQVGNQKLGTYPDMFCRSYRPNKAVSKAQKPNSIPLC
jgi:hypothetical protein